MNKNGTKLYKQGQLNGYTYCIRQIFEENTLGYTHGSASVGKLNNKCHNFSSEEQNGKVGGVPVAARLYTTPAESVPSRKEQRRQRREKAPTDGKLKFADRLRALLKRESHLSGQLPFPQDPYAFSEAPAPPPAEGAPPATTCAPVPRSPVAIVPMPTESSRPVENGAALDNHSPRPHTIAAKGFSTSDGKAASALAGGSSSTSGSSGGSGGGNAPLGVAKLSKTMNRLQAKIAQNKLLDKLKRTQQDCPPTSCSSSHYHQQHRVGVVSAPPSLTAFVRDVGSVPSVCIKQERLAGGARARPPRERPRAKAAVAAAPTVAAPLPSVTNPATALRNLRQFWASEKGFRADDKLGSHCSLDLDSSDSEPSDEDESAWQRPPFWNWDLDCSDASTVKSVRYLRIHRLRTELRKRYELLCKRQAAAQPILERQDALVRHLAEAARLSPGRAAQVLLGQGHSRQAQQQQSSLKTPSLGKRTCCYQHEGRVCAQPALPYTRHCTKHIMYNVDQLLFEHCTAKFADNTQCCVPVFDMCHELPLCPEHAKKRDNYNKMASEPKPKKPRKKSKPPALTRPPKRGKKKRQRAPGGSSPLHSSSYQSCLPLESPGSLALPSPASSSSSSSPCSSRSPPFLGGCESATTLLGLVGMVPPPELSMGPLSMQPHQPQQPQQPHQQHQPHQPHPQHVQQWPSTSLTLRVKPETKQLPSAPQLHVQAPLAAVPVATTTACSSTATASPALALSTLASDTVATTSAATVAAVLGAAPLGTSPAVENYGYVPPATSGMNPEAKVLAERMEPDLTSDLENQFSPDTIEKSLELPLDAAELANQATKLLEEHDFTEVLNKISDDAFSDFFAESKNGEYVPSKEETEELERALAAVSKDVHLARESLAKLSGTSSEVQDLPDLVDAFPDLPLSSSDLTSLTQALMGNTPEALRTVALLSSDLTVSSAPPVVSATVGPGDGFSLLEAGHHHQQFVGQPCATVGEVTASWLLGGQELVVPTGAGAAPQGASISGTAMPKQSVLAQESVS